MDGKHAVPKEYFGIPTGLEPVRFVHELERGDLEFALVSLGQFEDGIEETECLRRGPMVDANVRGRRRRR